MFRFHLYGKYSLATEELTDGQNLYIESSKKVIVLKEKISKCREGLSSRLRFLVY